MLASLHLFATLDRRHCSLSLREDECLQCKDCEERVCWIPVNSSHTMTYSLRESATRVTGSARCMGWEAQGTYRRQTGQAREDDLDDGAVEELLFGWFEGWNRGGEKATQLSVSFIPFFPFLVFQPIIFYLEILLIQSQWLDKYIYQDYSLCYMSNG